MHSHEHAHGHTHEPVGQDTAFALGALLNAAFVIVEGRFAIQHATIQVETGDPVQPCELVPDHVV